MKKPSPISCKKYCEEYETCTRTECNRKKGYRNGGDITMLEESFTIGWTKAYKGRRYREMTDIKDNSRQV